MLGTKCVVTTAASEVAEAARELAAEALAQGKCLPVGSALEWLQHESARPCAVAVCRDEQQQIVGWAFVMRVPFKDLNVWVAPHRRSEGLAVFMLDTLKEEIQGACCHTGSPASDGFWRKVAPEYGLRYLRCEPTPE